MKTIMKDALILFAITLIGGLCLGFVYNITKEPIALQEVKTKNAAYEKVFLDENGKAMAEDFQKLSDGTFPTDSFQAVLSEAGIEGGLISELVCAVDSKNTPVGLVLTVISKEGYAGDIKFVVGIKNDGTVNGISILSINETAGLGMKAKEESFQSQFSNKKVEVFQYTKNGATNINEIDAISGATITTNAITNGANCAITAFEYLTENGYKTEGGVVVE